MNHGIVWLSLRWCHLLGLESLDLNLFHDNGDSYLIRACTKNQYMGISKLTSDLTNIAGNIVSVLKAKVSLLDIGDELFKVIFFFVFFLERFKKYQERNWSGSIRTTSFNSLRRFILLLL